MEVAMPKLIETLKRSTKPLVTTAGRLLVVTGMLLTMSLAVTPRAGAQGDDAEHILKIMSDFVAAQKAFTLTYDSNVEVLTTELQKIQFTSSGKVQVIRPDKLHATRTGGYHDLAFVFDGKTLSVSSKDKNNFAQLESPGSIDQVIDLLREKYGFIAPGADLLFSNVYEVLMENVIDSKHIGRGVIDGVECEHLAFRTPETDWQIWTETGARPIPRKYVITSKVVTGAPQYTLYIKDWQPDAASGVFAFSPPEGATKVAVDAVQGLDEIPPGIVAMGGNR
jgi:hypothetical protein